MVITPSEKAVQSIRELFTTKFTAPSAPNQVSEDVWRALESPFFKQHIFASSFLAVIDHSDLSYRYVSPSAKDFTGFEASELMEKGLEFFLATSEDTPVLLPIYEKVKT